MRLEKRSETSREILPLKRNEKTRAALHYSQGMSRTQETNVEKGRKHGDFLRWNAKTLIPSGFFHRSLSRQGWKKWLAPCAMLANCLNDRGETNERQYELERAGAAFRGGG